MIYETLVQELDNSKIRELIENGASHADIVQSIQKCFSCFFKNEDKLKRYSNDFLVSDYINYCKNFYEGINENIDTVLHLLRGAEKTNKEQTYTYMALIQNELVEVSNKQWSFTILQKDFKTLDKYEYITEAFNLIENICENGLKVYFKYLLAFLRISKGKSDISLQTLNKMKFGNMFNELRQCGFLFNCFEVKDYQVPLSQWRNIACHKDYKIVGNKIECRYDDKNPKIVIVSTKEDLLEITKTIYKILQFINFAFKFFLYDNIDEINPFLATIDCYTDSRPENWHLPFVTELYINGLKVISIKEDDLTVKVEVSSVVSSDIKKSAIQSTIVLYKVWYYSLHKKIQVSYLDETSKNILTIETSDEVCKLIAEGKKSRTYLAETMKILYCDESIKFS